MDQLLNSTISLMSSLKSLYNATKTNSEVIMGCFSHLKKLDEVITQASGLTAETQDIIGLINSHSESTKQSINVLEKCFTYLTTEHNHVAVAANNIGSDLNKQLEALRVENKGIHYYLCDQEITASELLLEEVKNLRNEYYDSNFKNSSPDTVNSSELKEYEVILMNYKKANSTLYSKLDQCEDFTASKLASNSSDVTTSEDNSKEDQTTSDVVQTTTSEEQPVTNEAITETTSEEQPVINEAITETTSESVQSEVLPEATTVVEEVNYNTTLAEPEVILPETAPEVIYSEDVANQTIEEAVVTDPVAIESL